MSHPFATPADVLESLQGGVTVVVVLVHSTDYVNSGVSTPTMEIARTFRRIAIAAAKSPNSLKPAVPVPVDMMQLFHRRNPSSQPPCTSTRLQRLNRSSPV
ncbi:MAG: hypothetical protein KGQ60_10620 [Planctomycetes bacterium]|nr:hypothetical protein [Planctomycetota bacterium]